MVTTRYFNQREELTDTPDVFVYEPLPDQFRVKVGYLFSDMHEFLEEKMDYNNNGLPKRLWLREIVRALGVHSVKGGADLMVYFGSEETNDFFIGVEVLLTTSLFAINGALSYDEKKCHERLGSTEEDFNQLLRYFSLGYELVISKEMPFFQVIRKDNEHLHAEVVKLALRLLADDDFSHADEQFRDAHRNFQQGDYDDAITDACSAVESVLKVVLGVEKGTAKELIEQAASEGYFPSFMESSTGQWVNLMLELPSVRNRLGDAHGKGRDVPSDAELERFARLALNLAASHILFLVDEYKRRNESSE